MTDPTTEEDFTHPLQDEPLYIATRAAVEDNMKRMENLGRIGGVHLDPQALTDYRLELLIETLLPDDGMERLAFEARFTDKVRESLDDAERQVARMKLDQPPASKKSGLILPGSVSNGRH